MVAPPPGYPAAWDVTTGVGRRRVIDSGIEGTHPELGGKIASGRRARDRRRRRTDPEATAATSGPRVRRHHQRPRCGEGRLRLPAGIGQGRSARQDMAAGIQTPVDNGARCDQHELRRRSREPQSTPGDRLRGARDVVLVAAASNEPIRTGRARLPTPAERRAGPRLRGGPRGHRGRCTDRTPPPGSARRCRWPATGSSPGGREGPPGLVSTYTGTVVERTDCRLVCVCRQARRRQPLRVPPGHLDGRPPGGRARRDGRPAQRALGSARSSGSSRDRRPPGGWSGETGWGILDAGRAVDVARRVDRVPPVSKARGGRSIRLKRDRRGRTRARRLRIAWSASDPQGWGPRSRLIGLASKGGALTRNANAAGAGTGSWPPGEAPLAGSLTRRLRRPGTDTYASVAVDAAGNREAPPATARRDAAGSGARRSPGAAAVSRGGGGVLRGR